jgi:hypothetical protein
MDEIINYSGENFQPKRKIKKIWIFLTIFILITLIIFFVCILIQNKTIDLSKINKITLQNPQKTEIIEYSPCPEDARNMPDFLCIEGKVYKGITNEEDCLKINGIPETINGLAPVFICRAEKSPEKLYEEILYKQYINTKYGFKIDYPIFWQEPVVYPQDQRTEIHFNNDDFIIFIGKIWRQEKTKLISYEEYVEEFKALSLEEGEPYVIRDNQGFKFTNPIEFDNKNGFNLIFPTKTKNVILEIYFRGDLQDSGLFHIYNRMVSSFEFL